MSATNQPINKWYSILKLQDMLSLPELDGKLLNLAKTQGFVTAMASAPNVLNPQEWLPFLWGGEETAPFSDGEQLELYIDEIVQMWNQTRPALLESSWQWPEGCTLDEQDIVSASTRDFCEGVLQGWQLTRDDWETLMPEDSEDSALLGGVLLSLTMLYDPETTIATLAEQGMEGLEQFEEIFNAIPVMLCGLTQRGVALAEEQ
ncbi:YecA family protein [Vibrio parahaemolyticus]|nr:YecA family protein [Vibrio parahaemolyticus]EIV8634619.1 YecA family protein [Vibrio parahaemolyticus]EIZ1448507.1 YecA family protein [Vibrio parahaemolyticus]EJF4457900.1 YecA family protein [Vibrio parahaemolyticus]EKL0054718.1 YecA family protein [Vibrio parahaemolyticus]